MRNTTQPKTPLLILSLIAMSLATIGTASAQENTTYDKTGFYGGIGAGKAKSNFDNYNFTNRVGVGTGIGSYSVDDKDTAYKAFLGYQFNKNFALEGGYFDLGNNTVTGNLVPNGAGVVTGTSRYRGLNLDLVGNMPLSQRLSLLASVGAHYDRVHYSSYSDISGLNASYSDNQGANYKYGLGAQYKFAERLYVRAGAERYHFKDAFDGRKNVNMYTVNLVVPFGAKSQPRMTKTSYREEVVQTPMPQPVTQEAVVEQTVVIPPPPTKVTLSAESLFAFDKYELTSQGRASLDKVVNDLQGTNVDMVTITGYADRLGSSDYNMKLSQQRADSVKNYLMSKLNLDSSKVTAYGKGEENPVTNPDDCKGNRPTKDLKACLQPDRRVEIEIVTTKQNM